MMVAHRRIVVIINDIINRTKGVTTNQVPRDGRPWEGKVLLGNVLVVLLSLGVDLLKDLGSEKIWKTIPADCSVNPSHTVGVWGGNLSKRQYATASLE